MSALILFILAIVCAYVFITCIFAVIEVAAFLLPVGMLAGYGYACYAIYKGMVPALLVPYVVAMLVMPLVGMFWIVLMRKLARRRAAEKVELWHSTFVRGR